jgi:hypothetical protein
LAREVGREEGYIYYDQGRANGERLGKVGFVRAQPPDALVAETIEWIELSPPKQKRRSRLDWLGSRFQLTDY